MHSGVSSNQDINQKKLKGMPNTRGSMRSHQDTVKQPAVNGIKPNRSEPSEGFFT